MTKYDCIIVDDDEIDRLTVIHYVKRYEFLNITGHFDSSEAALQFAKQYPPDVMFLDIDMPGISGLDLRRELAAIPACIFITSFPDYAADSFETVILDFIVKPLKADRFERSIARLQHYLSIYQKAKLLDYSLGGDSLYIKEGYSEIKIQLYDIMYLEALKDYTGIISADKKYCVHALLGNLLAQKSFQSFVRIHRSYAVHKHFVQKVSNSQVELPNKILPIGRSYKGALQQLKG